MRTVREDLERDVRTGAGGLPGLDVVGPLLEQVECRVWLKWDQLKAENRLLRALGGLVEGKVLRPILGDRPAGCP